MSSNLVLRQKLIDCEALKFGEFTLTSGKKSSYYVNMKMASTNPEILKLISGEFAKLIPGEQILLQAWNWEQCHLPSPCHLNVEYLIQ